MTPLQRFTWTDPLTHSQRARTPSAGSAQREQMLHPSHVCAAFQVLTLCRGCSGSNQSVDDVRVAGSMNVLRYLGSANVLALAFALGTSLAIAQPTVPPAGGPAATPGAGAAGAPAPADAGQSMGSAWVKLCTKNEQAGNKQLCLVK